jgi:hypothetical protein
MRSQIWYFLLDIFNRRQIFAAVMLLTETFAENSLPVVAFKTILQRRSKEGMISNASKEMIFLIFVQIGSEEGSAKVFSVSTVDTF